MEERRNERKQERKRIGGGGSGDFEILMKQTELLITMCLYTVQ